MNQRIRRWLIGGAAALSVLAANAAAAAPPAMSKQAYKAAEQRIEAQAKADAKACSRLKGEARDLCKVQAEAREDVALALLQASYEPGPETEQKAKEVKAEAEFAVAKERCDDLKGKARARCTDRAEAVYEAAIRQAKVEKVDQLRELKADADEPRTRAGATPKERMAGEKARCWMLGAERERCLADVQRRYGKT